MLRTRSALAFRIHRETLVLEMLGNGLGLFHLDFLGGGVQ